MSRLMIVGMLVVVTNAPTAVAGEPPAPNPKAPVDYVKWVNDEFGKGITENAAATYALAAEALVPPDEALMTLMEADATSWTKEQREKLRGLFERNATCLKHFAAAAAMKDCFFRAESETGELVKWLVPQSATHRGIAKLLLGRARLRVIEGDMDGAMDDLVTVLRFARHYESQPLVIQYLVALSTRGLAYRVLLDVPRLAPASPDYQAILTNLDKTDPPPPIAEKQLRFEKVQVWDILQRSLQDADGDGRYETLRSLGLPDEPNEAHPLDPPQTLDAILAELNTVHEQVSKLFVPDYRESKARAEALEKRLAELGKNSLVPIFAASLPRMALLYRRCLAERNAWKVVLYLHADKAKRGRWPADLKQAVPADVFADLLDPFSSKPLIYRLKGGEPLLYSVSENGVSDGGEVFRKDGKPAWGETGDYVFWPRP